ncbi:MAG: hypothetical protein NTV49_10060 [Kiritimatiellaeota bacterium]|nr:hypothetical protein [Kiritimatiellota bacterium]
MKAVILDAAVKTDGAHMKTSRSVVATLPGAGVMAQLAVLIALAMLPGARAADAPKPPAHVDMTRRAEELKALHWGMFICTLRKVGEMIRQKAPEPRI